MFQSLLWCNGLGLPAVELTLRVDMQPSTRLVVLVALNVSRFALPLVAGGVMGQRGLDGRIVADTDLGPGLCLVVRRNLSFLL